MLTGTDCPETAATKRQARQTRERAIRAYGGVAPVMLLETTTSSVLYPCLLCTPPTPRMRRKVSEFRKNSFAVHKT